MNYAKATAAIKASLSTKAFNALMSEWQKAAAKGQTKLAFAVWYKQRKAQQKSSVNALVNSWFIAA